MHVDPLIMNLKTNHLNNALLIALHLTFTTIPIHPKVKCDYLDMQSHILLEGYNLVFLQLVIYAVHWRCRLLDIMQLLATVPHGFYSAILTAVL